MFRRTLVILAESTPFVKLFFRNWAKKCKNIFTVLVWTGTQLVTFDAYLSLHPQETGNDPILPHSLGYSPTGYGNAAYCWHRIPEDCSLVKASSSHSSHKATSTACAEKDILRRVRTGQNNFTDLYLTVPSVVHTPVSFLSPQSIVCRRFVLPMRAYKKQRHRPRAAVGADHRSHGAQDHIPDRKRLPHHRC